MSTDNDDGEVNRVTTCEKKKLFYIFYTIIYVSYVSHIFKKQQQKKNENKKLFRFVL